MIITTYNEDEDMIINILVLFYSNLIEKWKYYANLLTLFIVDRWIENARLEMFILENRRNISREIVYQRIIERINLVLCLKNKRIHLKRDSHIF